MKTPSLRLALLAALVASACAAFAQNKDIDLNPNQIAILRWYGINSAANQFQTGAYPTHVVFDGSSLWVSNFNGGSGSGSLTKYRPGDGALLLDVNVSSSCIGPFRMAYDGAHIWVTCYYSGNVLEVRASDGAVLNNITGFSQPTGVAFDGHKIWVSDNVAYTVSAYNVSDGKRIFSVGLGAPYALAYDGHDMWVTNNVNGFISKISGTDGSFLTSVTVGNRPNAMAFDGTSMWVTCGSQNVYQVNVSTGQVGSIVSVGNYPVDITFDGKALWVSNFYDNTISKIRAATGQVTNTIHEGLYSPWGLAFDGANVWVVNEFGFTLQKM